MDLLNPKEGEFYIYLNEAEDELNKKYVEQLKENIKNWEEGLIPNSPLLSTMDHSQPETIEELGKHFATLYGIVISAKIKRKLTTLPFPLWMKKAFPKNVLLLENGNVMKIIPNAYGTRIKLPDLVLKEVLTTNVVAPYPRLFVEKP